MSCLFSSRLLVLLRHTLRVSLILREYIDLNDRYMLIKLTATRWGFAMGWNYALLWLVSLPLEIIAASITISFWEGSRGIDPTVWVTIFFVAITVINLFGVKGTCDIQSRTVLGTHPSDSKNRLRRSRIRLLDHQSHRCHRLHHPRHHH